MILRFLRWIDKWLSRLGGEQAMLERQKQGPDYKSLIAQAEDAQRNAGFRKSLADTMKSAGVPLASSVLVQTITLYIAQLETSTFLHFKYESTMPIPIKNPEKLMFLRFTLFEGSVHDNEKYLIKDVRILLLKNQKYESSRLIDECFDGRKSIMQELDAVVLPLKDRDMLLSLKHALIKLHERNLNWKLLQQDAAREKIAVDLLENYLGIQQPALPAPEAKPEPKEDKEVNPFDQMQRDFSTSIPPMLVPERSAGTFQKKPKPKPLETSEGYVITPMAVATKGRIKGSQNG